MASEFYKDGMCYYSDGSDKVYVNSCKKGEYCQKRKISNNLIIGLCLIYKPDFIKVLEEKCSTNFECDINLICSEKCTINTAHLKPYSKSTMTMIIIIVNLIINQFLIKGLILVKILI